MKKKIVKSLDLEKLDELHNAIRMFVYEHSPYLTYEDVIIEFYIDKTIHLIAKIENLKMIFETEIKL